MWSRHGKTRGAFGFTLIFSLLLSLHLRRSPFGQDKRKVKNVFLTKKKKNRFFCTFCLDTKSTKKFKHGWSYDTSVHTPRLSYSDNVTSANLLWRSLRGIFSFTHVKLFRSRMCGVGPDKCEAFMNTFKKTNNKWINARRVSGYPWNAKHSRTPLKIIINVSIFLCYFLYFVHNIFLFASMNAAHLHQSLPRKVGQRK